jgi:hypothetical protein
MNLSVILPYRPTEDGYRESIFNWMLSRYVKILPDAEIIVCDSGDEEFNRSKSRNIGVQQSTRDYLLIGDSDTMPFKSFILDGISRLEQGESWLFLYDFEMYFNADQKSSLDILSREPEVDVSPEEISWEHKITSWAGQILMRSEDFKFIGGYDERFNGWGYEDNAFQVAADTCIGPHGRIPNAWTIHIWHPYSHATTFGQPMIDYNRNLYQEYLNVSGNRDAMMQLIGSR